MQQYERETLFELLVNWFNFQTISSLALRTISPSSSSSSSSTSSFVIPHSLHSALSRQSWAESHATQARDFFIGIMFGFSNNRKKAETLRRVEEKTPTYFAMAQWIIIDLCKFSFFLRVVISFCTVSLLEVEPLINPTAFSYTFVVQKWFCFCLTLGRN